MDFCSDRTQHIPPSPTPSAKEVLTVWGCVSDYIIQHLLLNKGVRIRRLGTFDVIQVQVDSGKNTLLTVRRPRFHLAKTIARVHGLTHDQAYVFDRKQIEPLKYADLALDVVPSRKTVKACVQETVHLFCQYIEKGENVAFVLKDIGMLIIEGKDVKMRFYKDFLKRLNGTNKLLKALLGMPGMRDSLLLGTETAASQTRSGCVIVFPQFQLQTAPQRRTMKPTVKDGAKPIQEEKVKKEKLSDQRVKKEYGPGKVVHKQFPGEQVKEAVEQRKKPSARRLPAVPGCSLKKEKGKQEPTPPAKRRIKLPLCDGYRRARQETHDLALQRDQRNHWASWSEEKRKKERSEMAALKARREREELRRAQLGSQARCLRDSVIDVVALEMERKKNVEWIRVDELEPSPGMLPDIDPDFFRFPTDDA